MSQMPVKFEDFARNKVARKMLKISDPMKYKKFMKKVRLLGADNAEVLTWAPRYDERI